jgi:hypothetical protein
MVFRQSLSGRICGFAKIAPFLHLGHLSFSRLVNKNGGLEELDMGQISVKKTMSNQFQKLIIVTF